ncbi:Fumarate reductase (CoM/CoB) subunit B [Metallosphaera sp. J1]|uniref:(Fe-S)-binding protein n=1 Tax=Metallosphaera TaxID=41980 RepID=UPI001EDE2033|nr:(Fe-S)-binding protein [Metallosphaera javensis (ex Hofmann et al. 2022)]MCG3109810.1 Fumarate reductase (CoM/CoB) subunit B [Metallosphaera javensis (ex Hofmann et al. 2022)]BCS92701.1 MAG: fumarate reductase (CoM/CoB) subunit B [Metallosphaera javensis (ex Sakai et al. 2022)]
MGLEDACVHCGFCLEACPTYVVTRSEIHSPRGRITSVRLGISSEGIETCMFCRRCELACPSGVEYGKLIHNVREESPVKKALNVVMERPQLAYRFFKSSEGLNSPVVRRIHELIPRMEAPLEYREESPEIILFPGCLMSVAFRRTVNNALLFIKSRGYRVEILNGCCGLSHYSEGDKVRSNALIQQLRERFKGRRVVSLSSNCSAHMREMGLNVEDFSEFALSELRDEKRKLTITIHDPCHANLMGITKSTRKVVERLGINVVEMDEPSFECGAGGGYFIYHPEIADRVMDVKAEKVKRSGQKLVLSTNPACSLALAFKGFRPLHLADILEGIEDLNPS